MHLSERDWLFINNIIYKIHSINDFDKMRRDFLQSIRLSIDYSHASFYLADKTRSMGVCDPVGVQFTQEQLEQYSQQYEQLDYYKTISSSPASYVYRETDLFSGMEREASPYYQQAYRPLNIHYALLLGLVYEQEYLGSIVLYRTREQSDFSEADIDKLEMIKNHMALRLAREMGVCSIKSAPRTGSDVITLLAEQHGLTEREKEIVKHLYQGDSTAEICQELCIAQTTLKKHISNAYKKLGIGCRSQLYKLSKC